jgi:hypothetical protein
MWNLFCFLWAKYLIFVLGFIPLCSRVFGRSKNQCWFCLRCRPDLAYACSFNPLLAAVPRFSWCGFDLCGERFDLISYELLSCAAGPSPLLIAGSGRFFLFGRASPIRCLSCVVSLFHTASCLAWRSGGCVWRRSALGTASSWIWSRLALSLWALSCLCAGLVFTPVIWFSCSWICLLRLMFYLCDFWCVFSCWEAEEQRSDFLAGAAASPVDFVRQLELVLAASSHRSAWAGTLGMECVLENFSFRL